MRICPRGACKLLAAILALAAPAQALEPDQLLLLTNRNFPQGKVLAEFYQQQRNVPAGRILELPLPLADDIGFDAYERNAAPAVREFLRTNHLEEKVTCIVTFFGVPLRIAQRRPTPAEQEEIAALTKQQAELRAKILVAVEKLESEIRQFDKAYTPPAGNEPQVLLQRAIVGVQLLGQRVMTTTTAPALREEKLKELAETTRLLLGPAGVLRFFRSEKPADAEKTNQQLRSMAEQISNLQEKRYDPDARAQMRKLIGEGYGEIELLHALQGQQDYLQSPDSAAAFDNELALLWWAMYPRSKWRMNLLHYGVSPQVRLRSPRTLMVCRLDAPQLAQVRAIVLESIKAEKEGLKGQIVLDSRGIGVRPDERAGSYGWYDQSIRDLAEIIRTKTKMQMLHDDKPAVLPANSANDVALYCGWYSVGNYVPSCRFNAGAVGFHVASVELTSLRDQNQKQWARNLINDHVVATLGPVAEPYLHSFPRADDFFSLLLTGKLTLAEVYWQTQPLTSWMMTLIGDPLYRPYKNNPMLQIDDLPPRLRALFRPAALTLPSTVPASS